MNVVAAAGRARSAADSGPDPILEVEDVHVRFGGVLAVNGTTFAVPRGQMTGLIGPNGAGKSTLLKVIGGAIAPQQGSVIFERVDITGDPAHAIAQRGLIKTFQLSSEFPRLTLIENLVVAAPDQDGDTFLRALRGKRCWRRREHEIIDRASDLIDQFQLSHATHEYAGRLSGGQKRLLELMRALMTRPKLLLLDEPLAGVNPSLRLIVERHLIRLRDEGLTMVMVEHDLASVERCCHSVVVMADGRVLSEGSMAELRQRQEVVDAYLAG